MSDEAKPYLVCHDYGTGGLWWWIAAPSPEAITEKYQDVLVFAKPPSWWTPAQDRATERRLLDDPDTGALTLLRR